jgi:hypothetical protein
VSVPARAALRLLSGLGVLCRGVAGPEFGAVRREACASSGARSLSNRTKIADVLSASWVRDHYRLQLVGVKIFCGTDS